MIPNNIWNKPQKIPAKDMAMMTDGIEPPELAQAPLIKLAVMTVIGPVGPLIWLWVPPNNAAKKPSKVAPISPLRAPMELAIGESIPLNACMPNARAKGNATMPAVMPPKMSPLMFLNVRNAMCKKVL